MSNFSGFPTNQDLTTGFQRGQYRVLAATDVKEMKRQEKRRAKEERREQKKIPSELLEKPKERPQDRCPVLRLMNLRRRHQRNVELYCGDWPAVYSTLKR